MKQIDLSIIVVSYNTLDFTSKCLDSIKKYTPNLNYEIIVVDNASSDGSVEYLSKLSRQSKNFKLVKSSENIGFSAANNLGVKKVGGEFVLFLNSDTEFTADILTEMVSYVKTHEKLAMLSCKLIGKDGKVQGNGGYFPTLARVFSWMTIQDFPLVDKLIKPFHPLKPKTGYANKGFFDKKQNLDWVTGAFILTRKEILDNGVSWDKDYFMYTEDTDLCYQVKKLGWEIEYNPKWSIKHYGGASSSTEYSILSEYQSIKRFYKKHYSNWQMPILRIILKIGAMGRMVLFGILEGKETFSIYAKAFKQA